MRILYAITRAVLGGAQTHVLKLLRHRVKTDSVGLVINQEGFLADAARELGVQVWVVPGAVDSIHPASDLRTVQSTLKIIRDFKPDIVHAHSSKAGITARLAAKLAGVPAVFTAHGWAFSEGTSGKRQKLGRIVEKTASWITDRIIVVSNYDCELAIRCGVIKKSKMTVVHNCIPDCEFVAKHAVKEKVRCVMVGRFSAPKDHVALIRAAAKIGPQLELVLVGDGELLDDAKAVAQTLGIDSQVQFLGDRQDVPKILSSCDICALLSNWEGFPYAVLEGMRAGLPMIASDVGGIPEAVIDGETGILIPRGDSQLLEEKLRALVTDKDLRETLGSAGRKRFLANFTIEQMLGEIDGIYDQITSKQRS